LSHQLSKGELKMLVFKYASKKDLKASVGQRLKYIETSIFGNEYVSTGKIVGANRPHITGMGREFFAEVTMNDGLIVGVK
jgi:hypothetical protein